MYAGLIRSEYHYGADSLGIRHIPIIGRDKSFEMMMATDSRHSFNIPNKNVLVPMKIYERHVYDCFVVVSMLNVRGYSHE